MNIHNVKKLGSLLLGVVLRLYLRGLVATQLAEMFAIVGILHEDFGNLLHRRQGCVGNGVHPHAVNLLLLSGNDDAVVLLLLLVDELRGELVVLLLQHIHLRQRLSLMFLDGFLKVLHFLLAVRRDGIATGHDGVHQAELVGDEILWYIVYWHSLSSCL